MSEPFRKTHVVPANTSTPEAPLAEVRIARDRLLVTLAMPGVRLADTVVLVNDKMLTVRSIPGRGNLHLTYPLPARGESGQFVARECNGVWDIAIQRPSLQSD